MTAQPDFTPPDGVSPQEWAETMEQPVIEGVRPASQDPTIDGSIEPERAATPVDGGTQ